MGQLGWSSIKSFMIGLIEIFEKINQAIYMLNGI